MNIMINTICNMRCSYCFAANSMENGMHEEISIDNFRFAIRFLKSSNSSVLRLLGGEPTLHSNFRNLIELAVAEGMSQIVVFTNGLFDPDLVAFLDAQTTKTRITLIINLNSPEYVGSDSYSVISENLALLHRTSVRVHLGINLYSSNMSIGYFMDALINNEYNSARWTIAIPSITDSSGFDVDAYYTQMIPLALSFLEQCYKNGIRTFNDCHHIPMCYLDDSQLRRLLTYEPDYFVRKKCSPSLDVYPDLRVIRCFGASEMGHVNLRDYDSAAAITDYFRTSIDDRYFACSKFVENGTCFMLHGECRGGCIGLARYPRNQALDR